MIPRSISKFQDLVARARPKARIAIDAPRNAKGAYWIDIADGDFETAISWQTGVGFGIFDDTDEGGFGDKPSEIFADAKTTAARLLQLLEQWAKTARIEPMELKSLRELVGTKQVNLAQRLKISQAAVSKVEKRGDVKLSSLNAYIEAIGGKLELRVRFKKFHAPLKRTTVS